MNPPVARHVLRGLALDNSKEAVAAYPIRRATVGIVH